MAFPASQRGVLVRDFVLSDHLVRGSLRRFPMRLHFFQSDYAFSCPFWADNRRNQLCTYRNDSRAPPRGTQLSNQLSLRRSTSFAHGAYSDEKQSEAVPRKKKDTFSALLTIFLRVRYWGVRTNSNCTSREAGV